MTEYDQETTRAAVAAIEKEEKDDTVRLSSGILIRPRHVPESMVTRIYAELKPPPPPVVEINEGGKKWKEPNPSDPEYREKLSDHALRLGEALFKLMALRGIEIVELPEGFAPYEKDESWTEELEAIGLSVPPSGPARYIEWVRYRLIATAEDYDILNKIILNISGISEEEIQEALDRFRSLS